jgi:hypothetical protein
MRHFLSFLLLNSLLILSWAECAPQRARLEEVTGLIFQSGKSAVGRRSTVPQLSCSGQLCKKMSQEINSIYCKNIGYDGADVIWECQGALPKDVELAATAVSCEGFNGPNDLEYITAGSCGLVYKLKQTGPVVSAGNNKSDDSEENNGGSWLLYLFFILVAYFIYRACTQPSLSTPGTGGGGIFPGDTGPGIPPSYSSAPPTYSESCSSGNYAPNAAQGPGFFTGLGAGGLMGYAMGRRNANYQTQQQHYNNLHHNQWNSGLGGGGIGASHVSSRSDSDNQSHSSSSYATTSRR